MHITRLRFLLKVKGQTFKQNIIRRTAHSEVDPRVQALRDKLLYCDYLDNENICMGYLKRKKLQLHERRLQEKLKYNKQINEPAISIFAEKRLKQKETPLENKVEDDTNVEVRSEKPLYMPYSRVDSYESIDTLPDDVTESTSTLLNTKYKDLYEKYLEAKRIGRKGGNEVDFEEYMENNDMPKGELWKVPPTWMTDFEEFDDSLINIDYKAYGTPDPSSEVSSIPCGGCGALLHCKDPAIPGYLPSELFLKKSNEDLKLMICQRCHFLKYYNASLEVKVSIEDYPKLLEVIKTKKCAVLLIVDLTDFPCSIWPDLKSILHPFTPIYLVGNKVDLLPRDCPKFFDNVKKQLLDSVLQTTGINQANITHVALTSAKTGYGIEELINKLQHKWSYKGDVYLVGCTNVGKSSMFNALLNSDYCKVQAVDLIQRATISQWPGTTLNLLKFPILNPTPEKLYHRTQRLIEEKMYKQMLSKYRDTEFKKTRNMKYANLQGTVGRTFTYIPSQKPSADPFSEMSHKTLMKKVGFDESQPEYKQSRWCYDTPGTIQQDQILDLLTTDELLATLPSTIISPRTFILRPKQTIFVAGMGRLDFLEGDLYMRCTLFTSSKLPITMCYTADADDIYNQLLQTEAFVVPINDPKRLEVWPRLESKEMQLTGIHRNQSVADVVLSSIGWIAITPHENENVTIRAWTPQGRGIYLRTPALLSKSVFHRGYKIEGTPLYTLGRQVYVK
ncbi:nitric oxide-associated protein 1 [Calliopsis andreniformis]|uniref:nitric oxide-associated protein 1 n=1 Tax=Calliopsis andreniformis TaxID=337506 RepID=UPI003FCC451D